MRCPVCRAEIAEDPTCRRCKADLSLLVGVERTRRAALSSAASAAAAGDGMRALQFAEAAHRLSVDADSWRWLAAGALLIRDFKLALECWRHAVARNEPHRKESAHE